VKLKKILYNAIFIIKLLPAAIAISYVVNNTSNLYILCIISFYIMKIKNINDQYHNYYYNFLCLYYINTYSNVSIVKLINYLN